MYYNNVLFCCILFLLLIYNTSLDNTNCINHLDEMSCLVPDSTSNYRGVEHFMSSQVKSCHVMSCQVKSSHVMSCHVMSCQVMSCHVMSCQVMSCHVMSCQVMSCHVMSSHVMSCHVMSSQVKSSQVKSVPQAKSSLSLKLSQVCPSSLNIVINYSFDILYVLSIKY